MTNFECVVFCILIFHLKPTGAFPRSGLDMEVSRTRRGGTCIANLQYQHNNICCLKCPAGTHVKSPCTREGEEAECEECEHGTFTEHSNGLKQCLKCMRCRTDQDIVRPCGSTHDTQCQCKTGRFCVPEEACEVCKKCSRCEEDEEVVRNCTPTTNTQCKKIPSNPGSSSANSAVIVAIVLGAGLLFLGISCCLWKRFKVTDTWSHLPHRMKGAQHHTDNHPTKERRNGETRKPTLALVRPKSSVGMEDERKVLCESLNSSASNSQHSLTSLPPSPAFPTSPAQVSPVVPRRPNRREEEPFPKLIPVNGEESLRKCFDYFEEIEVNYHKRFFRHLDISDNVIKSKEHVPYEDKIHDLLSIWVEKVGRDASLNDLLNTLLVLNQKRTAETIRDRAIQHGHYLCENQREEDALSESPSEKIQS